MIGTNRSAAQNCRSDTECNWASSRFKVYYRDEAVAPTIPQLLIATRPSLPHYFDNAPTSVCGSESVFEVHFGHHMAEFAHFGLQVVFVVAVFADLQGYTFGDFDAGAGQGIDLAWVVGHQFDPLYADV